MAPSVTPASLPQPGGLVEPARTTVATIVDDRAPYDREAVLLFRSLEQFGGAMRRARRRAHLIDGGSRETRRQLEALGVEICSVPAVEPRFRLANKLAMFAEVDVETELLVALDSDILVAGDFSHALDPGVMQAKVPDGDLLPLDAWQRLFDHFGVALPQERHRTSLRRHWTHAYFNTGVIFAPTPMAAPLHERWLWFLRSIVDDPTPIQAIAATMTGAVPVREGALHGDLASLYFADQWAFALARADLGLPYATLPLALNFPTIHADDQRPGTYIDGRERPGTLEPLLIHHHHRLEPSLGPTGYEAPDAVLRRVSRELLGGDQPRGRADGARTRTGGRQPAKPFAM